MSNVTSITEARHQRSWNRLRWNWQKAILADPGLPDRAKLLSCVLVSQFAHHESAECSPGIATLAAALATSEDTIKRALRALEDGGWITRGDGCHRGKRLAITFRMAAEKGGHSAPLKAVKECNPAPVSMPERGADLREKGCKSAPPPTPPYKDKPNLNQEEPRRKPHSNLEAAIVQGGCENEAWDIWLSKRRHPPLVHLGDAIRQQGKAAFVVPFKYPPSDETGKRISERWVAWALSKGTTNEQQ